MYVATSCLYCQSQSLTKPNGFVAQLVRAPPCHGGGRGFKSHRSRNRGRTPRRLIYLRKRIFGLTKHTEILIDWNSKSFSVGSMNLCRDVLSIAKLSVSEQRSLTLAHIWIGSLMAKLQGTASWEFDSPSIHSRYTSEQCILR